MRITLRQLRSLAALAEEGHFGRAAAAVSISQPALSVQIRELEAALGARLIERGPRGVFVTPTGREVLRRAPTPARLIADRAYDARELREGLAERSCEVVIPPNPTRKNPYPWDPILYRARNVVERMFRRLKDSRRIATRYHKLARNFLAGILLAAAIT